MKNTLRLLTLLFLGISVVFFIGCEDDDADDVSPLAGTWVMTNMEQTALYTSVNDLTSLGLPIAAGDTLGGGTVTWAVFNGYFGVEASIEIFEDGTYLLEGTFPVSNDTLGYTISTIDLSDPGTWEAADDLSTILLAGAAYVIPPSGEQGPITVDDVDNPTTLGITYGEVETITTILPVDANQDGTDDMWVPDISVVSASSTTLAFEKQ